LDQQDEREDHGDAGNRPSVASVQPEYSAPEPQDHGASREPNERTTDHEARLVNWTAGLVVITAVLAIITAIGSYAAFEQLREIRISAPIALAQANAAQAIAETSKQSVLATQKLADAAQTQASAALSASATAQDQAASTRALAAESGVSATAQRTVADIEMRGEMPLFEPTQVFISGLKGTPDKDGLVTVFYQAIFLNAGKGVAQVSSSVTKVWANESLPQPIERQTEQTPFLVAPGAFLSISGLPQQKWPKSAIDEILSGKRAVYFLGRTVYANPSGQMKLFCYAYRMETEDQDTLSAWKEVGGPEHRCEGERP